MFPLCTSVTLFLPCASAYLIARRTSLFVPVGEIGLRPTPESQRICFLPSFSISLFKNSSSFFTSGVQTSTLSRCTRPPCSRGKSPHPFFPARARERELPGNSARGVHRNIGRGLA